jgi:hypothetical protein
MGSNEILAYESEHSRSTVTSVKQNAYFKRIQQEIRDQRDNKKANDDKTQKLIEHENDKKVSQTSKVDAGVIASKLINISDKVKISKTSKQAAKKDNNKIKTGQVQTNLETSDKTQLSDDGQYILKILGLKIDFSNKISDLMESFMRNIVQARSHNFFLRKYAQFKVGIIGQLLSTIGVAVEEIKDLQKKAIKGAVEENVKLMGENIYNLELTELVHGKKRKVRRALALFREVEQQLIRQMNMLGKTNFWSMSRLIEERIKQCKKIKEEFLREKDALQYKFEFIKQEKVVHM